MALAGSVGSSGSLRSSGTCTSGIDRAQSSDDGSDGDKSKGITTSARGNDLSDNESDASDGEDVKMSNIDGSMLIKAFRKVSERMKQAGNNDVGYITHGISSLVKHMTKGVVYWGGPGRLCW